MVTKEFFLKNIEKFSKQKATNLEFIDKEDIIFVSFPLIKIKNIKTKKYSQMRKIFLFEFIHEMYSLKCQRKIFKNLLIPMLFLEILKRRFFIAKAIFNSLKKWKGYKKIGLQINI